MSYTLTLNCGCIVYVAAEAGGSPTRTRVLQSRAAACRVKSHQVGVRVWIWELLPGPAREPESRRSRRAAPLS